MDPNIKRIINAGKADTDSLPVALEDLRQIPREFYNRLRERRARFLPWKRIPDHFVNNYSSHMDNLRCR